MSTSNLSFNFSGIVSHEGHNVGDCFRMGKLDINTHAFEDCVILGFAPDKDGDIWARLSRPYGYVSGGSLLLTSETFEVLAIWLNTRFVKVQGNYLL